MTAHDKRLPPSRSAMYLYAKDRHKRAARMLGYALTADVPDLWDGLAVVLSARLTETEIASIAFAALSALDPPSRVMTFNAAHWGEM